MIEPQQHLNPQLLKPDVIQEATRDGFGRGLLEVAHTNRDIIGLTADLATSTRMEEFAASYPARFIQVGVAEQNLVTVAAGLALTGKIPFTASFAAFSPGRNWEQIRTTICINQANVKIVGSHAGLSAGPDGATHQMLEDIALMRVLPNMTVVVPADAIEAAKATRALAAFSGPAYLRLSRAKTPQVTTDQTPFSLGKAQLLRHGRHLTIAACGSMVYQALVAAEALAATYHLEAEVINVPVIKPLDTHTILASVRRTGAIITAEEHQVAGGLGSAIAELISEHHPVPLRRIGVHDQFGQSGSMSELIKHYGLTSDHIIAGSRELLEQT